VRAGALCRIEDLEHRREQRRPLPLVNPVICRGVQQVHAASGHRRHKQRRAPGVMDRVRPGICLGQHFSRVLRRHRMVRDEDGHVGVLWVPARHTKEVPIGFHAHLHPSEHRRAGVVAMPLQLAGDIQAVPVAQHFPFELVRRNNASNACHRAGTEPPAQGDGHAVVRAKACRRGLAQLLVGVADRGQDHLLANIFRGQLFTVAEGDGDQRVHV
jgi:hypothetical protein